MRGTEQRAARPTFIGIGAQKCASSWLYRVLAEHPQVGVSAEKEVDFFSYRFDHGYYWYESQFESCDGKVAVGEISPSYFCEPAVPERIQRYLPSARILLSLRDPIARALSNHRHEVRMGHIAAGDATFETGLANNPMYIEQGRYAAHLRRWLDYFPREQILIVFMDDIEANPGAVARAVYRFVGVDPGYEPAQTHDRANRSYANRYRALSELKDVAYRGINRYRLGWLWRLGTATGLRSLYRGVNVVSSERVIPPPRRETLAGLRRTFEPEIRALAEMTGRSLDTWLRC